ncbi:hypothetical protein PVAP13_1NG393400 [Panicum virgatum]|uniref:Uncharacterized protein n=1 Tax=Panicum virgatum TaxID=38727 RepID=A0A8T0X2M1_PANVG|nr:hypothetical protein PVAP13_1NG393400 [Panicum virgatum]
MAMSEISMKIARCQVDGHNTSGKNCAQRKLGMNKRPPWKRNVSDEGVGDLVMIFNSVC